MAAAQARSLDIDEQQVAVDFFEDPNGLLWHSRVLLRQLGPGSWIVGTPDIEVEACDLTQHRIVPIARNAPYPDRIADELYAFDVPITDADLASLRAQAAGLAQALGAPPATGATPGTVTARWFFADTGSERFGEEVDDAVMGDPLTAVIRDAKGLAQVAGAWELVERVEVADKEEWLSMKQCGPGRDCRILPVVAVGKGDSLIRQRTLTELVTDSSMKTLPGWPLRGPRATAEVVSSIRAAGLEIAYFHGAWVTRSGVSPTSAVCIEHRTLLQILGLLVSYDELDVMNVAGVEMLRRRILMIERAVRKSPKTPDFSGLDSMLSHMFDESGGIVASKYDQWVAEGQRTQAQIMKQQRMFNEERASADKGRQEGGKAAK